MVRMHFAGTHASLLWQRLFKATLAIGLAVTLQLRAPGQQRNATEDQVKAAYLFNFAKLAEWPLDALPEGPSPFVICVRGGDEEFLKVVKSVVVGKMIGSHSVMVKPANSDEDLKSCHIIFYRASLHKHAEGAIESLPKIGVLLVGEDGSFLREGGMINLVRDHATIRFEVNPDAMDHSEIHFNSKILVMAKTSYGVASAYPSIPSVNGPRQLEHSPAPEYSQLAERLKLTGTAQVEAVVKPDGTVREVRIVGGHPLLAEALSRAVKQWKYQPSPKETTEKVKFSFTPPQ